MFNWPAPSSSGWRFEFSFVIFWFSVVSIWFVVGFTSSDTEVKCIDPDLRHLVRSYRNILNKAVWKQKTDMINLWVWTTLQDYLKTISHHTSGVHEDRRTGDESACEDSDTSELYLTTLKASFVVLRNKNNSNNRRRYRTL